MTAKDGERRGSVCLSRWSGAYEVQAIIEVELPFMKGRSISSSADRNASRDSRDFTSQELMSGGKA